MKTPPAMFAGILLALFAIFMLAMVVWRIVFPDAQPGVGGWITLLPAFGP
jgi:hypothetical protein